MFSTACRTWWGTLQPQLRASRIYLRSHFRRLIRNLRSCFQRFNVFSFWKLGLLWVASIKQMRFCRAQISKLLVSKRTTCLDAFSPSSDYFQFQTSEWACQFSSSKLVNMICSKNGFCWTNTWLQTESQLWTTSKESAWCRTTASTKQFIISWVSGVNLENVFQDENI